MNWQSVVKELQLKARIARKIANRTWFDYDTKKNFELRAAMYDDLAEALKKGIDDHS